MELVAEITVRCGDGRGMPVSREIGAKIANDTRHRRGLHARLIAPFVSATPETGATEIVWLVYMHFTHAKENLKKNRISQYYIPDNLTANTKILFLLNNDFVSY